MRQSLASRIGSLIWRLFESKGLKVNLGKAKVMVIGGIAKVNLSKSDVNPCGLCSLRVKASSILCIKCVKLIHGICAVLKKVNVKFSRNLVYRKYVGNVLEAVQQEESFVMKWRHEEGHHV